VNVSSTTGTTVENDGAFCILTALENVLTGRDGQTGQPWTTKLQLLDLSAGLNLQCKQ